MRFILSFLLLFSFANLANAQILQDVDYKAKITLALAKTYNFEFAEADKIIAQIKVKYPQNPCAYTLAYMKLYLQYAPINTNKIVQKEYLSLVQKSFELAELQLKKNPNDIEGTFFILSALGNLAAWHADNNEMMKAVNLARQAFPYMKKGMKLTEVQSDFLFTTGLYNYYIEQYPEDHPIVKPFMVFFSDGSKKTGLAQLEKCFKYSLFTSSEAAYYAIYIYMKHENKPEKALQLVESLLAKYPNNTMYLSRKAEAILALNQTTDIPQIIQKLNQAGGGIYPIMADYFEGKQAEMKNNNILAAQKYNEVIKAKMDVRYTKDYVSMAYLGLAQIALETKKYDSCKLFLKKVDELAEYISVKKQAIAIKAKLKTLGL